MGGRREAVPPCVNENELVPFDCWGWRPALEMEEEGEMEEGKVDDWFAEPCLSMSVLVVVVVVVLILLLELMVLFCEHCDMGIMLGGGAYGAGGDVMLDKSFVVFADDIDSEFLLS
jgi:hypothetical protein